MAFDLSRAVAGTKALPAHPAFQSVDPTSVYSPGRPRERATISQRSAPVHSQAFGGREAIDWVYDAIGLYADPAATSPYYLKRPDGTKLYETKTKGTPPDWEKGPQDLYELLKKPNPFQPYSEFMSLAVIDLLLVGNCYWYFYNRLSDGKPLALYRLAPSHVKIKPGPYGPLGYEYQPPGVKKKLTIKPEDILHLRRPNPHDQFYGMGVVQAGGRAMDLDLAITDTQASYFENRADPSVIVQSERRVPRDVFNKLRAQMRASYSGSRRSGELMVLEAGLKASTLSTNAKDALFDTLQKMSRDRILTLFRTSPLLFGLVGEASGSNKVSDARREFDNYTLRPFFSRLDESISLALASLWDVEFVIDYRQLLPPEDAIKVGESVAKVPGVKVREVRRQYTQFGIEESTGDAELDEMVLNKPEGDLGPDGQPVDPSIASGADPNLSSEPGRPPKVENTTAIGVAHPAEGKAMTIEDIEARLSDLVATRGAKAVSTPAADSRLPNEKRPDDPYATARASDINTVMVNIKGDLDAAATRLERELLDHVEGKALKTSDLVSRIRRSPGWAAFKESVEKALHAGTREAAQSGVLHSNLAPEEDIDYDSIANTVVHRPEGLRSVIATLKDRVVKRVADARSANAERDELNAAVRAVIAEWKDGQALTIADTEATHAYNEGTLTAAEAAGLTQVYVMDGEDHDQPCVEANGQVWDIATARSNRVEHPRCRRAFVPIGAVA